MLRETNKLLEEEKKEKESPPLSLPLAVEEKPTESIAAESNGSSLIASSLEEGRAPELPLAAQLRALAAKILRSGEVYAGSAAQKILETGTDREVGKLAWRLALEAQKARPAKRNRPRFFTQAEDFDDWLKKAHKKLQYEAEHRALSEQTEQRQREYERARAERDAMTDEEVAKMWAEARAKLPWLAEPNQAAVVA